MRLDLFLKSSRLVPRRTLAQEFCDLGLISVNGTQARSSKAIKPGDSIEIKRRNRITVAEVLALPEGKQVSKAFAHELVRIISEDVTVEPPI